MSDPDDPKAPKTSGINFFEKNYSEFSFIASFVRLFNVGFHTFVCIFAASFNVLCQVYTFQVQFFNDLAC